MSAATDWITALSTLGAATAGVAALIYAGRQLREARKSASDTQSTTQSQFLLTLLDHFARYWEIHVALRPGGKWTKEAVPVGSVVLGPTSPEEWAKVEAYMGLFERLNVLHDKGVVDLEHIDLFYRYRLINIWQNPVIFREKIVKISGGWRQFIALSTKLNVCQLYAEDIRRVAKECKISLAGTPLAGV